MHVRNEVPVVLKKHVGESRHCLLCLHREHVIVVLPEPPEHLLLELALACHITASSLRYLLSSFTDASALSARERRNFCFSPSGASRATAAATLITSTTKYSVTSAPPFPSAYMRSVSLPASKSRRSSSRLFISVFMPSAP